MDLEELQAFLSVAESGSFLAAANALRVSRTTLRRRVEWLEGRVGARLVESTSKGVVLTEAGVVLARRGRIILQEASALFASVREVGREPAGVLRVLLPVGMPPHYLAPLFGAVRRAHPRLRVETRLSNDPLGESLVDVDVVVHFGEETPRGPWLSRPLRRVPERLLASHDYLARRGSPSSIDELADHELLSWQAPGEDARQWPTLLGSTFTVEPVLVTSDIHLLRQCALAGLGIALIPDAGLPDPGVPKSALVRVLPDVVGRQRAVRVAVPAALAEIPKIKLVLTAVQRFVDERARSLAARREGAPAAAPRRRRG